MEGLGSVLFLLLMGVVYLLNHVFESRGKRTPDWQKPRPAPDGDAPEVETPHEESYEAPYEVVAPPVVLRPVPARPRVVLRPDIRPRPSAPAPLPAARLYPRHLFAGRENLRRAVVAMTVLGPPVSQQSVDGERRG